MEINYYHAESHVEPTKVRVCKSSVLVRRNIEKQLRTDEDGSPYIWWVYEEARLSPEDFDLYVKQVSAENALKSTDDSNNLLIVMEALADLYDYISTLTKGGAV